MTENLKKMEMDTSKTHTLFSGSVPPSPPNGGKGRISINTNKVVLIFSLSNILELIVKKALIVIKSLKILNCTFYLFQVLWDLHYTIFTWLFIAEEYGPRKILGTISCKCKINITFRQKNRQTDRQTDKQTDRQIDWLTNKHTGTKKQTDRQTKNAL